MNAAFARRWGPCALLALAAALGGLRTARTWALFGGALAAWAALSPGLDFRRAGAAVFFFAWAGLAALFSPDPAASLAAFARLAALGFFFLAASEEGADGWLKAVKGLGFVAAVTLAAQRLAGLPPHGFIGANPNYSAAFCAAAFPLAALGLSGEGPRRERWGHGLLLVLLAAGLACSGSRGGTLAALAAAGTGLAVLRRWRWLAGLVVCTAALAALLPASAWEAALKLGDPRAFARPRIWGAALAAAADRPLLGWGPGLFERAFEAFKFPFFDGISYYGHFTPHAHSEPLNVAAEAGFPAAFFFLAAAAVGLLSGGRERLALKLCALAALLQACADITFYSGAVALLFWGSLAFSRSPRPAGGRWHAVPAAVILGGLAFGALRASGPDAFRLAAYREAAGSPPLSLAIASSALHERPMDATLHAARGRALAAAGDLRGAAAAFARALELEPFYAGAREGLSLSLAAGGLRAEACAAASAAPAPVVEPENAYQRELLRRDPAAEAAIKDICRKKKAGGATAPGRRTR